MAPTQVEAAATTKPKSTVRRRSKIKDLIAEYQRDETVCRYKNKLCLNTRARKRHGGLHTFCDIHREAANRNQRRLDLRKRILKRQREARDGQDVESVTDDSVIDTDCTSPLSPSELLDFELLSSVSDDATVDVDADVPSVSSPALEPSTTPVALKDEDLHVLRWLFAIDETVKLHAPDTPLDVVHDTTVTMDPICLQWA